MLPQESRSTVKTRDGLSLAGRHYAPPSPRARVVLLHGYAEHAGRYRELLGALTGAGYECHALDLRGHGLSGGERGHVRRFEEYLEDLDLFLEAVERRDGNGSLPRFLVGHSLGGLVSLSYVLRRPEAFAALAVSSPFLEPAMEVPWLKAVMAAAVSRVAPRVDLKSGLDSGWLSRDPEIVAAYQADPLVFDTVNVRWFSEVRAAQEEILERAGEIRLPVLLLLGGADPVAAPARGRRVFEPLQARSGRSSSRESKRSRPAWVTTISSLKMISPSSGRISGSGTTSLNELPAGYKHRFRSLRSQLSRPLRHRTETEVAPGAMPQNRVAPSWDRPIRRVGRRPQGVVERLRRVAGRSAVGPAGKAARPGDNALEPLDGAGQSGPPTMRSTHPARCQESLPQIREISPQRREMSGRGKPGGPAGGPLT